MSHFYFCLPWLINWRVLLWSWWSCRDLAPSYFCHFSFTSRQHTKNSPQIQITMWLQVRVRHGTNPYYQLTTHCTDWYCASALTCFYNEIYLSKKKHLNWRCLLYSQQQTFCVIFSRRTMSLSICSMVQLYIGVQYSREWKYSTNVNCHW
jgi:hypothetical protein